MSKIKQCKCYGVRLRRGGGGVLHRNTYIKIKQCKCYGVTRELDSGEEVVEEEEICMLNIRISRAYIKTDKTKSKVQMSDYCTYISHSSYIVHHDDV